MNCKIFNGDYKEVEDEMNGFLCNCVKKVISVTQDIEVGELNCYLVITLIYE